MIVNKHWQYKAGAYVILAVRNRRNLKYLLKEIFHIAPGSAISGSIVFNWHVEFFADRCCLRVGESVCGVGVVFKRIISTDRIHLLFKRFYLRSCEFVSITMTYKYFCL